MINGLDEKVYGETVKINEQSMVRIYEKCVNLKSFSRKENFFDEFLFDCFHMHKEKVMLSVRGLSVLKACIVLKHANQIKAQELSSSWRRNIMLGTLLNVKKIL